MPTPTSPPSFLLNGTRAGAHRGDHIGGKLGKYLQVKSVPGNNTVQLVNETPDNINSPADISTQHRTTQRNNGITPRPSTQHRAFSINFVCCGCRLTQRILPCGPAKRPPTNANIRTSDDCHYNHITRRLEWKGTLFVFSIIIIFIILFSFCSERWA